jgi:ABC-type branched-subunit amino acid transport system substrate-binding protein
MGKKGVFIGILIFALSFSNSFAEELPAQAQISTYTLAYQGPLTGPESEIGIAEYTGVKFAVTKFAAANPKINIQVIAVDDQGDPAIANQVAPAVASNASIIGLIGPAYSGAAKASFPYYVPSSLPIITPSASNEDLTSPDYPMSGIPIFHRVVPTYFYRSPNTATSEGSVLIRRAASQTPINKVFIVRDDVNSSMANDLVATLSALGSTINSTVTLSPGNLTESDFSQAAATLLSGGAASVIFAGYSPFNAAGVIKALKIGDYSGKYFVSSLTNPTQFKDLAGSYGNNAELTSDYIHLKDASTSIAREFSSKMGAQPGPYATEAINATNIFLSGIKAGVTTRQGMSNYIDTYKGTGIAGNVIQFTAYGELSNPSWGTYTISNSQLVYKGLISVSTFAKKMKQTITFTPPTSLTSAQFPYTLSATASSGLPVTITSSTTGVCTVSGQTLTLVSAGRCTLVAIQVGNIAYEAARSITKTINLTKATQTITFAPPTSLTSAQFPYTLTTTASSGLPVIVTSSTIGVCTVSDFALTLVSAGRCTLTASQAGNETYGPARSVTRSITLSKATQTITFTPPTSLTSAQFPYTLSATASSGLPVTITSSTTGICTVSGLTATLVTAGRCTLIASQTGDSTYGPARSVTRSITLSKATQTITFTPPTSMISTEFPYALSATVSSGLPVTITSSTTSICTVSGFTLTLVTPGRCTLTASQAGDSAYFAAPLVTRSITLSKASQTITFTPAASITLNQSPYLLTATASSGLTVSLVSSTTSICTVSGVTLTLVTAGICTLTASQAGDSTYSAAPLVTRSITLSKATQTITFALPTSLTSAQFPYTLTATASSGLPVTITSSTAGICTVSGVTLTMVTTGTCTLSASQGGDEDYFEANSVVSNVVLNKITQTIDFTPSNSLNLDQTPYTLTATASSGLPVTFTSSTTGICTVSGFTLTLVTTGTCTLSASQSGNAIYESTSISQEIMIRSKPSVVIRPGLISNGSPLIVGSFARIDCLTSGCGSPYGKWTGVPNSFNYRLSFEICDGETCTPMEKSEISATRTRYVMSTEQNFCIRATLIVSNAAGSTELELGPNCVAESVSLFSYGTLNWKNSSPAVGQPLSSSGISWASYNGGILLSGIVLRCTAYVTNQLGIPDSCIQVGTLDENNSLGIYTITSADSGYYLTIAGVAVYGNVTKYATVASTNLIPSS